jgi:hypothetical protein
MIEGYNEKPVTQYGKYPGRQENLILYIPNKKKPPLLQHALRWNSLGESEEHQENLGRRNGARGSRDVVEQTSNL